MLGFMVELMTRAEAAKYLRVKESWLRDHAEVPRIKLGHLVRYSRSDLDAWIDGLRVSQTSSGRSARALSRKSGQTPQARGAS